MYHIVWLPKYRTRVLEGALACRIRELIEECAAINDWRIDELKIQVDHVHLLIQLRPSISVSRAVHLIKGKSNRIIREEFPNLKEFYWGDSFWGDAFFVETVGQVNLDKVKAYIRGQ